MNWSKRRVIVTGGAGFIGGALVAKLLDLGAEVTVVDKIVLQTQPMIHEAKLRRLTEIYRKHGIGKVPLEIIDLALEKERFQLLAQHHDTVFHLSAVFGGREFVDTRQTDCSKMLAVDHNTINASYEAGIERFHYASSACVYADSLNRPGYLLKEDDILTTGEGWKCSDNLYGFAKLMGELQLLVYFKEHGFKGSSARYLTVYGEGELDATHAIAALVEKALDKQNPYEVWGSGNQERGFTYVDDIAIGSILACEKITDGTPINLGWDKRFTLRDVAQKILENSGHTPSKVFYNLEKPEGPFSRALDISRAKQLLGWEPKIDLEEGLRKTVEWHSRLRKQLREPAISQIAS